MSSNGASTQDSLSTESLLALPFALAALTAFGVLSIELIPGGLEKTAFVWADIEFNYARVIMLALLGYVLFNRSVTLAETKGMDLWAAYVTLGLIVMPPFVPQLEATLAAGTIGTISAAVATGGFVVTTYFN